MNDDDQYHDGPTARQPKLDGPLDADQPGQPGAELVLTRELDEQGRDRNPGSGMSGL